MITNPLCPTAQKPHTPASCTDQHSPNSSMPHGPTCHPPSLCITYTTAQYSHPSVCPTEQQEHNPTCPTPKYVSHCSMSYGPTFPGPTRYTTPTCPAHQHASPLSLGLTSWELQRCTPRTTVAHHNSTAQTSLVALVSSPTCGQT